MSGISTNGSEHVTRELFDARLDKMRAESSALGERLERFAIEKTTEARDAFGRQLGLVGFIIVLAATVCAALGGYSAAKNYYVDRLASPYWRQALDRAETAAVGAEDARTRAEHAASFAAVPIGAIVPFFGHRDEIPDGWALCDGSVLNEDGGWTQDLVDVRFWNKPVPNLQDRYLKGAPGEIGDVSSSPRIGGSNDLRPHHHGLGSLTIDPTSGGHKHTGGGHQHMIGPTSCDTEGPANDNYFGMDDGNCRRNDVRVTGGEHEHDGGAHNHLITGRVGCVGYTNAYDGDVPQPGANQPAYLEVHFIIRVK